jgi:hypothetical protein
MINALHLIWIIPTCICVGMFVLAFFVGAAINNCEYQSYNDGFKDGYKTAKEEEKQDGRENR